MGHRLPKDLPEWITTADLAPAPANPFYEQLNRILQDAGFDPFVEDLCRPCYVDGIGRPKANTASISQQGAKNGAVAATS